MDTLRNPPVSPQAAIRRAATRAVYPLVVAAVDTPAPHIVPLNANGVAPVLPPMGTMPTRLVMRHNGMEKMSIRIRGGGRKNKRKSGHMEPPARKPAKANKEPMMPSPCCGAGSTVAGFDGWRCGQCGKIWHT